MARWISFLHGTWEFKRPVTVVPIVLDSDISSNLSHFGYRSLLIKQVYNSQVLFVHGSWVKFLFQILHFKIVPNKVTKLS